MTFLPGWSWLLTKTVRDREDSLVTNALPSVPFLSTTRIGLREDWDIGSMSIVHHPYLSEVIFFSRLIYHFGKFSQADGSSFFSPSCVLCLFSNFSLLVLWKVMSELIINREKMREVVVLDGVYKNNDQSKKGEGVKKGVLFSLAFEKKWEYAT